MNAADELLGYALTNGLGDTIAIQTDVGAVTYDELNATANRAASAFVSMGLESQDRVLLLIDDRPEFFYAYLGVMKAGGVPVALNLRITSEDFAYIARDSSCRIVITDADFYPLCKSADNIVIANGSVAGIPSLAQLMSNEPETFDSIQLDPEDMALWMYTSGTTGAPKAAVHLQRSIPLSDRYLRERYNVGPGDKLFSSSKLFFAFSLGHILLASLRCGATAVLHAGWPTAESIMDVIERHRPRVVFSVPTFYRNLLQAGVSRSAAFRNVDIYFSAGEGLPEPLFRQWKEATGADILEGIGATENLVMFLANRPEDVAPATCGIPLPATDVKLVDENHEPVSSEGEPGVLWIRTGTLASEYWGQAEKTEQAFLDGWYVTGDVFIKGPDGHYRHQGRADDMLKISGQWVSPAEIEDKVLSDERVSDAAVIGAPNEEGLVRLALCLTTASTHIDQKKLETELRETLTSQLSIYKCPRRFIYLEDMPRTTTGKIQRFKLRQLAAEHMVRTS